MTIIRHPPGKLQRGGAPHCAPQSVPPYLLWPRNHAPLNFTAVTTPAPLDYAPRPPGHIRRHAVLYLIVLLLLSIAFTLFYYRQPLFAKARILYWQRQCLTYSRPPDSVIAELDPQRADNLMRRDFDYQP